MPHWLERFAKNPKGIGSVAPSSPALADLMTRDITPGSRVLELGPGDGAITVHALKLIPPADLTLIESDPGLATVCRTRFPGVRVHTGDAEDVMAAEKETFDFVLSGIPFAVVDQAKRKRMFSLVRDRLKPGGSFIMFQYSLTTQGELKEIFTEVETRFTPWNIPPAFVYVCRP